MASWTGAIPRTRTAAEKPGETSSVTVGAGGQAGIVAARTAVSALASRGDRRTEAAPSARAAATVQTGAVQTGSAGDIQKTEGPVRAVGAHEAEAGAGISAGRQGGKVVRGRP